jgi:hypothetical protein
MEGIPMEPNGKSWLALGSGAVGSGGAVALISQFVSFGGQLDSIDKFLDAGLFMTLIGISIGAGGLLSAAADQKRTAAYAAFLNDKNIGKMTDSEAQANEIAKGASYFLLAFLPSLMGLFSCVGFDAIFESPEQKGGALVSGLVNLANGGWGEELGEAIVSGGFLGAALLMLLLGFLSAKVAFVR